MLRYAHSQKIGKPNNLKVQKKYIRKQVNQRAKIGYGYLRKMNLSYNKLTTFYWYIGIHQAQRQIQESKFKEFLYTNKVTHKNILLVLQCVLYRISMSKKCSR